MADVGPDYNIERMKMRVQIGQLHQNRLANELRIMQLKVDLARAEEAIESIDQAIAAQQEQMDALPGEDEPSE